MYIEGADSGELVALGRGYDSFKNETRGNSMQIPPTNISVSSGQSLVYELKEVKSYKEVCSELEISAAATFGLFGWQGNAKAKFAKECRLSSFFNCLIVRVTVTNEIRQLKDYYLRDEAVKLLEDENYSDFLRRYGDKFIAGIKTGGEFIGLMTFFSVSQNQQQAISAKLTSNSGKWETSVGFELALKECSENSLSRVTVVKLGGRGAVPRQSKLIEAALNFPNEVAEAPIHISFVTKDYDIPSNRPVNRRIDLDLQYNLLKQLVENQDKADSYFKDFHYALEHPKQFDNLDVGTTRKNIEGLEDILKSIKKEAWKILQSPFSIKKIEEQSFNKFLPLPVRRLLIRVLVHLEEYGDCEYTSDFWSDLNSNFWAGTTGQSRRLEGFNLDFDPPSSDLKFEYMAHMELTEDSQWVQGGQFCGTKGKWYRLEGFAIRLVGSSSCDFDVYYQAHLQEDCNTPVYKNGEFCGTRGKSKRVEAMRVWVSKK
ncbi:MAG: hypothetical protein V7L13_18390 [Nostoc sp.]|uniref:hypothetical protein n=1 Tax=Nostoc sp. TaxID=1180 RepID=UPI002FFC5005